MGGKKPVGDHPSRGSYSRRLTATNPPAQHHHSLAQHSQGPGHQQGPVLLVRLEGEGNVPDYQDFSLFSAFSSDHFSAILTSDSATTSGGGDSSSLEKSDALLTGRDLMNCDEDDKISVAEVRDLLQRNSHLEKVTRELQDSVSALVQGMDRMHYEHCALAQHLQQSLQMMQMQLYDQGACFPPFNSGNPNNSALISNNNAGTHHVSSELNHNEADDSKWTEEFRKIKERLCTVEGRHKTVQGKVSQLDKLYGPTSAAWGKHIKDILHASTAPATTFADSSNSKSEIDDNCVTAGGFIENSGDDGEYTDEGAH